VTASGQTRKTSLIPSSGNRQERPPIPTRRTTAIGRQFFVVGGVLQIKNHHNVEEAQNDDTRQMQREYRAFKLKEERLCRNHFSEERVDQIDQKI
jgi:sulfur relay (sulfurtransferase) DsrF/TusC family protein